MPGASRDGHLPPAAQTQLTNCLQQRHSVLRPRAHILPGHDLPPHGSEEGLCV